VPEHGWGWWRLCGPRVGFARTLPTLGSKWGHPLFPSVSLPGARVPRAVLCLSFPAGAAGTDLCTTFRSRLGWALGRLRPKAHQPPEGRGAKLPPGTAQSCLEESDRGDLFPRAPSWRGAGWLSSPSVSSVERLPAHPSRGPPTPPPWDPLGAVPASQCPSG